MPHGYRRNAGAEEHVDTKSAHLGFEVRKIHFVVPVILFHGIIGNEILHDGVHLILYTRVIPNIRKMKFGVQAAAIGASPPLLPKLIKKVIRT